MKLTAKDARKLAEIPKLEKGIDSYLDKIRSVARSGYFKTTISLSLTKDERKWLEYLGYTIDTEITKTDTGENLIIHW